VRRGGKKKAVPGDNGGKAAGTSRPHINTKKKEKKKKKKKKKQTEGKNLKRNQELKEGLSVSKKLYYNSERTIYSANGQVGESVKSEVSFRGCTLIWALT